VRCAPSAAIPALLERLRDPTEDPFIQARAALAIGLIRDPSVAPELIPLLRAENLPVTARRAIADALGDAPGARGGAFADPAVAR
jgi:HEAT repeat protein